MLSLEGSGCASDGLQRVMRGDHIGTLFHKDAHLLIDLKGTGARDMAVAARDGSRRLQVCLSLL
jgi:delta-1-pyrroline-5-carboxylate synthetase